PAENDVGVARDRAQLHHQRCGIRAGRDRLAHDDEAPVVRRELVARLLAELGDLLLLAHLRLQLADVLAELRGLLALRRDDHEIEGGECDGHHNSEHDRLVGSLHLSLPRPGSPSARAAPCSSAPSRKRSERSPAPGHPRPADRWRWFESPKPGPERSWPSMEGRTERSWPLTVPAPRRMRPRS